MAHEVSNWQATDPSQTSAEIGLTDDQMVAIRSNAPQEQGSEPTYLTQGQFQGLVGDERFRELFPGQQ